MWTGAPFTASDPEGRSYLSHCANRQSGLGSGVRLPGRNTDAGGLVLQADGLDGEAPGVRGFESRMAPHFAEVEIEVEVDVGKRRMWGRLSPNENARR